MRVSQFLGLDATTGSFQGSCYNARMAIKDDRYGAEYWSGVARGMEGRYHLNELLCEQKKNINIDLVRRWADISGGRILKTDLFEEALGQDQFLFDLTGTNGNIIGMDISHEIAARAKERSRRYGSDRGEYVCCDVRRLPFKTGSIDIVISNSTLDHFRRTTDITTALQELRRVLTTGGTLIVTMINKGNLTEPLFRLWISLGLLPFFGGKTYSIKELKRALEENGFEVRGATAVLHNPRLIVRIIVDFLHRLDARRFDPWSRKGLAFLDTLENKRTKYLTGIFIAVKAVKREKLSAFPAPGIASD